MSAALAIESVMNGPRMSRLQNRVIAICILIGLADGFNYFVLGYVLPNLAADFGQGPGQFAFVFTASSIGTMLSASMLAPLADRFGRRRLIGGGVILFSLSTMAAVFATTIPMLCVVRFIAGIGAGCVASPLYALATEYSISRLKNTSATLVASGISLGGMACGFAAAALVSSGWRTMFLLAGAVPLLILVATWRWMPESIGILFKRGEAGKARAILSNINPAMALPVDLDMGHDEGPVADGGFAALFRDGRGITTLLVWGAMFFSACAAYVLFSYLATFLIQGGIAENIALLATSLATFGGLVGGNVIAMVIDRTRLKRAGAVLGPVVTIVCTAILAQGLSVGVPSDFAVLVLVTGIGFGLLGTAATVVAIGTNSFPVAVRSTAMGWSITVANAGGLVSPLLGGVLLEMKVAPPILIMMTIIPSVITAIFILLIAKFAPIETQA